MTNAMPSRFRPFAGSRTRVAFAAIATLIASALLATAAAPPAHAGCYGERSKSRAKAARAIMCLVNQERARRGISTLRYSSRLSKVARRHAKHMVRYSFTGHVSPRSGSLITRVKRARAVNRKRRFWVGENLGWGGSAGAINRAWMNSSIHRKATLYRKFRRVGIGVVRGLPNGSRRRSLTYVVTFAG